MYLYSLIDMCTLEELGEFWEVMAQRFLSISGHTNRETNLNKSLSLLLQSFKKYFILPLTALAGVNH